MVDALNLTRTALANFSLAEASTFLQPLILFVIGIAIYSIFIFKFYRFIASKNIFKLDLHKRGKWVNLKKGATVFLYILEHLVG